MRVNELAAELHTTPDTVRYYTRIGLLQPQRNRGNGYKSFSDADKTRLNFILSARSLGFTVEDVRQILDVADTGNTPCTLVRRLIENRLGEIEKRYQAMKALRNRMKAAVRDWNRKPDEKPTGDSICHLIEEFTQ